MSGTFHRGFRSRFRNFPQSPLSRIIAGRRRHARFGPEQQPFGDAREKRPELDGKVPRHEQGAKGKHHVAWQTHPLPEERRIIERAAAGIGEPVLVNRVQLRPADRKEIEDDPKDETAIVEPKRELA